MIFDEIKTSSNINEVKTTKFNHFRRAQAQKAYSPERQNLGQDSLEISEEAFALAEQKTIQISAEDIIE